MSNCFYSSRGIRQGDPLSPYLFLLCAEGLNALLRKAVDGGQLKGISVCGRRPAVSHLFFADDSLIFIKAGLAEILFLKSILLLYEQASGHKINYNKSALCVNPSMKVSVSDLLGVPIVENFSKYLGLPTLVGKNKKQAFGSVRDKVWQKIRSWKGFNFSKGGNEVLIKAVLQALPTYFLSVFKLPLELCDELNSLIANFWWGFSASGKKIHWVSWKKLCCSKLEGGLGFKSIGEFNQAIVAKCVWNLIQRPDSLLARVLKGRYFHSTDIINAEVGSGALYTWRSLMWGRDLLVKGLRWSVGDGGSINIFSDPWLPRPSSFRVFSPPSLPLLIRSVT